MISLKDFGNVFGMLSAQLRNTEADAATTQAYYEALKHLPLDALQETAMVFARESGRKFFPTSAEWYDAAKRADREQVKVDLQLAAVNERPAWQHECDDCEDTGWQRYECTGDTFCGRKNTHAKHDFVRVCACRQTNRTYQRHQFA